jgi:hypothetical protein
MVRGALAQCPARLENRDAEQAIVAGNVPAHRWHAMRGRAGWPAWLGCKQVTHCCSATATDDEYESETAAEGYAQRVREFAHHYLEHGLMPVPAWAAKANCKCCCPRGVQCPRPGKHPRSVHVGPGRRDYF